MGELIVINQQRIGNETVESVNARNVHSFLGINKDFSNWIKNQIRRADLEEEKDWVKLALKGELGQQIIDYYLTLDAAKHIAMMSRSPRGKELRQYFIDYEKNAKKLFRRNFSIEWQAARAQSKLVRREETDVIKDFVAYAISQGSESATRYYANISKMQNKALFFLEQNIEKPNNFRDLLSAFQLMQLGAADKMVADTLIQGMRDKIYYKDIYQLAKQKIEAFSMLAGKSRIEFVPRLIAQSK